MSTLSMHGKLTLSRGHSLRLAACECGPQSSSSTQQSQGGYQHGRKLLFPSP